MAASIDTEGGWLNTGANSNPGLPVAVQSYVIEQFKVAAAVLLEEKAQVGQRLLKHPGIDQHQHDQEPAQATVAVQKRVDGRTAHGPGPPSASVGIGSGVCAFATLRLSLEQHPRLQP